MSKVLKFQQLCVQLLVISVATLPQSPRLSHNGLRYWHINAQPTRLASFTRSPCTPAAVMAFLTDPSRNGLRYWHFNGNHVSLYDVGAMLDFIHEVKCRELLGTGAGGRRGQQGAQGQGAERQGRGGGGGGPQRLALEHAATSVHPWQRRSMEQQQQQQHGLGRGPGVIAHRFSAAAAAAAAAKVASLGADGMVSVGRVPQAHTIGPGGVTLAGVSGSGAPGGVGHGVDGLNGVGCADEGWDASLPASRDAAAGARKGAGALRGGSGARAVIPAAGSSASISSADGKPGLRSSAGSSSSSLGGRAFSSSMLDALARRGASLLNGFATGDAERVGDHLRSGPPVLASSPLRAEAGRSAFAAMAGAVSAAGAMAAAVSAAAAAVGAAATASPVTSLGRGFGSESPAQPSRQLSGLLPLASAGDLLSHDLDYVSCRSSSTSVSSVDGGSVRASSGGSGDGQEGATAAAGAEAAAGVATRAGAGAGAGTDVGAGIEPGPGVAQAGAEDVQSAAAAAVQRAGALGAAKAESDVRAAAAEAAAGVRAAAAEAGAGIRVAAVEAAAGGTNDKGLVGESAGATSQREGPGTPQGSDGQQRNRQREGRAQGQRQGVSREQQAGQEQQGQRQGAVQEREQAWVAPEPYRLRAVAHSLGGMNLLMYCVLHGTPHFTASMPAGTHDARTTFQPPSSTTSAHSSEGGREGRRSGEGAGESVSAGGGAGCHVHRLILLTPAGFHPDKPKVSVLQRQYRVWWRWGRQGPSVGPWGMWDAGSDGADLA